MVRYPIISPCYIPSTQQKHIFRTTAKRLARIAVDPQHSHRALSYTTHIWIDALYMFIPIYTTQMVNVAMADPIALPTLGDNQLELKVEWFSQVLITYQLYQPMVQATGNQLVDGLIILSGIELENLSSNEPNAFCTKQEKGNSSASGITRRSVI